MWNQLMSLPNYSAYMSLSIALSAHLPFIHIFYTKSMSEKGPGFANFNSAVYLSENIDICLSFKTLHFLLFFYISYLLTSYLCPSNHLWAMRGRVTQYLKSKLLHVWSTESAWKIYCVIWWDLCLLMEIIVFKFAFRVSKVNLYVFRILKKDFPTPKYDVSVHFNKIFPFYN